MPTIAVKDQPMNCLDLAIALGLKGPWIIYGIKKANRQRHAQGRELLIFSGRYSTPARVAAWLESHPDFVANQVLAPKKETPAPHGNLARLPA